MSKFITAKKELSSYAFECGYIEANTGYHKDISIWMQLDGCFHVRGHDHINNERLFWDAYESMTDARKAFKARLKEFKQTRKIPKD